tara:strand:- start:884 stop:1027 length:144 start_codon:yes stop_codon:yes gene_type:complete
MNKKIIFLGEELTRQQAEKALKSLIETSLRSIKANDYDHDAASKIQK